MDSVGGNGTAESESLPGFAGAPRDAIGTLISDVESCSMGGDRYLWSGLVPVRLAPEAVAAIVDWCRSRRVLRPMAVVGGPLVAGAPGLALVHAIEAEGLALWTFDRATSASLSTVADAVASYHFENCDAVIGIGGAVALEVAKATALMSGQRNPYGALAAEPGADGVPVDAFAVASLLVVPLTPAAALSVGAAVWIADETGIARPLRHPALRPAEAILADDLLTSVLDGTVLRSAAVAALIVADAGAADDASLGLLRSQVGPGAIVRAGLDLAGLVEAGTGPRRRLALGAAVAAGLGFATTMATLAAPAGWLPAACRRLKLDETATPPRALEPSIIRATRAACGPEALAALDRVLAELGLAPADAPRRRSRRGRLA